MSGSQSTNPVHRWYANLPGRTLNVSPANRYSTPLPIRTSPSPPTADFRHQVQRGGDTADNSATSIPPHMRGMRRLEIRRGMEESHYLASKARITNLNPPVDMRLLEYVNNYDSNLMCPICHCPFVDPVALYDCDHCFCRDCLLQTWTDYTPGVLRGNCPTCRSSTKLIGRGSVSKILCNILDELVVKCPKFEDGCTSQMKRGEVSDHMNIYCGYGWVSCPVEECDLPVWRKDVQEDQCNHYGVSCIDCHETMTVANLEIHWRRECPDRKLPCDLCGLDVFYREFETHTKNTCDAISIPCPGSSVGCMVRSQRSEIDEHVKTCTLSTLAPFLETQKRRVDEQQEKQALLERKLQVLEGGFKSIQDLLDLRKNEDVVPAVPSRIPLLDTHNITHSLEAGTSEGNDAHIAMPPSISDPAGFDSALYSRLPPNTQADLSSSGPFMSPLGASSQAWIDTDMSEDVTRQYGEFNPSTFANDPYSSPLHHLLSLHENLREEVARVAAALQELDGRHSMLILDENLRLKEDMSYLGGQIGGVARQVGWLTSARLQEQSRASGSAAENSSNKDEASQSAVTTAATALRGAARMVNVGREGLGIGRRVTDEGRTKL